MAGASQVMASGVRALEKEDVDPSFMTKLAKIATAEIISSKELNADWQRAASSPLVSIGSHLPDLMIEEIFLHLTGPNSTPPPMVQILADFASVDALQFTPRLKGVLSRVLPIPILGNVRDVHRPIFANAFKCWCQAVWQYRVDFPSHSPLDEDVILGHLSRSKGICAGLPLITWPQIADQFYNEKGVVEVLKIGEGVGEGEEVGVLVKREGICKAIQKVMGRGKEAEERRERIKKLAEMAKSAIEKGGSSYFNVERLIQHMHGCNLQ